MQPIPVRMSSIGRLRLQCSRSYLWRCSFASIAANMLMTDFAAYPVLTVPSSNCRTISLRFANVLPFVSALQLSASILLGLFSAAVIVSRLLFLRINVAGVCIALFGGIAAAAFLSVSALGTWILSQPGVATDAGAMRVASLLAFASGASLTHSHVGTAARGRVGPVARVGLMPRWICWFGLVVAVIAELSLISMVFDGFTYVAAGAGFRRSYG